MSDYYTDEGLRAKAADETQPRHLRREAELLLTVAAEDRTQVALGANRMRNLTGCRYSDAIESEVRAYTSDVVAWRAGRERDHAEDARMREMRRGALSGRFS